MFSFAGIKTSQDARFYAISAKFDPFSNEGKDLVIQFQVKHEQNIDCGGGYIKLVPSSLDPKDMHGESPYNIMFGPDICGPGTKKVHVIFNYKGKNLLTKKDIRCKVSVKNGARIPEHKQLKNFHRLFQNCFARKYEGVVWVQQIVT